jgi:flagellar secretion chaperone FliS
MNLPHQALARYGNVKVMTASPADHIVMLYDGCFRFLREAIEASKGGDRGRMGERIGRANNILSCLLAGLDRSVAPKLCDQLEPLYGFCMRHILEANLKNEPKKLEEVIGVLSPLRNAWADAAAQLVRERGQKAAEARAAAKSAGTSP